MLPDECLPRLRRLSPIFFDRGVVREASFLELRWLALRFGGLGGLLRYKVDFQAFEVDMDDLGDDFDLDDYGL